MQSPDWYPQDVSRETLEKLTAYTALLKKWTSKINLVSKSTVEEIETRHVWDSAQIYDGQVGRWMDFGSGGGLPGIIVAILAHGQGRSLDVTLVESDRRKAAFLRTCARELNIPVDVLTHRVEDLAPHPTDVISARALASLDVLLGFVQPHLTDGGTAIFMKGAAWADEVRAAEQNWRFSCDVLASRTNNKAAVLRIKDIERA